MTDNNIKVEDLSFEDALMELENIVRELESGKIKLDDAVIAYEKAVKLKTYCREKLNTATLKVEKIEINKDGELSVSSLEGVDNQTSLG